MFTLRFITCVVLNWGTPLLNSFVNEMNVFRYFNGISHIVHPLTNRLESRVYEGTRVSVTVTEGITTWYQSSG